MSVYGKLVKNPLVTTMMSHIDVYPTPINLSYLWSFGSLAGLTLVAQIVTGVLLAMHYAPEVHLAFNSVEHIMRDVNGGAILRYMHANGASMFLLITYSHMFRGLSTKSKSLIFWGCNLFSNDGNCIYGLCFTLRSNEFLRCYCNY